MRLAIRLRSAFAWLCCLTLWGALPAGAQSQPTLFGTTVTQVALNVYNTCALATARGVQCRGMGGPVQADVPPALQSGGTVAIAMGDITLAR